MSPPSQRSSSSPRPAPQALGNDLVGAALLSGVAGYVDTAGFLALYGLLTAHVTGDLVTAGSVVVENFKTGAVTRLAMIPIFMLAVAAAALFARRQKRHGREPLTALLGLMTVALAVFGTTGVALHQWAVAPDGWAVALIGATGVVAMAIQNTLMRDALSTFCPTTIMTGNLTQVTIDLVDILLPAAHGSQHLQAKHLSEAQRRLRRFGYPLLGFTIGAGLGAMLTHALGLWSIALPTVVTGSLTFVAWKAEQRLALAGNESALGRAEGPRLPAVAVPLAPRERIAPAPAATSGRHASGTRIAAMQVPEPSEDARPEPKQSGTYATSRPVSRAEEPLSSRSAPDRRRARQ